MEGKGNWSGEGCQCIHFLLWTPLVLMDEVSHMEDCGRLAEPTHTPKGCTTYDGNRCLPTTHQLNHGGRLAFQFQLKLSRLLGWAFGQEPGLRHIKQCLLDSEWQSVSVMNPRNFSCPGTPQLLLKFHDQRKVSSPRKPFLINALPTVQLRWVPELAQQALE